MTICARIVAACLILGLSLGSGLAQSSTDKKARALYFAAEQAYSDGKYHEAWDSIKVIKKLLGETNPLLEALKIKVLYGLGEQDSKGAHRYFRAAKSNLDSFFEMEVSKELSVEMAGYVVKVEKKLAAYEQREADRNRVGAPGGVGGGERRDAAGK